MLDRYALWLGYGVMGFGGLLLMGVLLLAGIAIVNHFGSKLWHKLKSLYDLRILRRYLLELEAQGKTLCKSEISDD